MASSAGNRRSGNEATLEALADVFKCFICMEQLNDARMCPHCSKLCCYNCIMKWITENRAQCPHCRTTLHMHALIKCRWADEVTQQLDTLQVQASLTPRCSGSSMTRPCTSNSDTCEMHSERLTVFCTTCDQSICHRCALFDGRHGKHSFQPLDVVYSKHIELIRAEMDRLKARRTSINTIIQQVDKNIKSVKQAKDDRVREIRSAVELMMVRLESLLNGKLNTLTSQRGRLTQETELLDSLLNEVQAQITSASPANLIFRSPALSAMFGEVHKTPMTSFVSDTVPAEFPSELIPAYDTSTFIIHQFSQLRQRVDPIYSPPLHVGGLSWRLKIYPDGNGVVRGNYLSVFLELSAGVMEAAKYEYRVEMIHQGPPSDATKNVLREFASEFEVGECWGYNRFFRLDILDSEGYHCCVEDTVILKFQVRSPTYYQKCRDQQWYISQLEANEGQWLAQISEYKTRLAISGGVAGPSTPMVPGNVAAGAANADSAASAARSASVEHNAESLPSLPGGGGGGIGEADISVHSASDANSAASSPRLSPSSTVERCPAPTPSTAAILANGSSVRGGSSASVTPVPFLSVLQPAGPLVPPSSTTENHIDETEHDDLEDNEDIVDHEFDIGGIGDSVDEDGRGVLCDSAGGDMIENLELEVDGCSLEEEDSSDQDGVVIESVVEDPDDDGEVDEETVATVTSTSQHQAQEQHSDGPLPSNLNERAFNVAVTNQGNCSNSAGLLNRSPKAPTCSASRPRNSCCTQRPRHSAGSRNLFNSSTTTNTSQSVDSGDWRLFGLSTSLSAEELEGGENEEALEEEEGDLEELGEDDASNGDNYNDDEEYEDANARGGGGATTEVLVDSSPEVNLPEYDLRAFLFIHNTNTRVVPVNDVDVERRTRARDVIETARSANERSVRGIRRAWDRSQQSPHRHSQSTAATPESFSYRPPNNRRHANRGGGGGGEAAGDTSSSGHYRHRRHRRPDSSSLVTPTYHPSHNRLAVDVPFEERFTGSIGRAMTAQLLDWETLCRRLRNIQTEATALANTMSSESNRQTQESRPTTQPIVPKSSSSGDQRDPDHHL